MLLPLGSFWDKSAVILGVFDIVFFFHLYYEEGVGPENWLTHNMLCDRQNTIISNRDLDHRKGGIFKEVKLYVLGPSFKNSYKRIFLHENHF